MGRCRGTAKVSEQGCAPLCSFEGTFKVLASEMTTSVYLESMSHIVALFSAEFNQGFYDNGQSDKSNAEYVAG
jgi:hypothetical protein